ncbi:hypothetical protein MKW92_040584 [Papaver armeniacum]|nr:hypothetical protein MKW92_040584 [Papaver armeniacum]
MRVSPESLQYETGFLGTYDVAIESPLQHARKLERIGVNVCFQNINCLVVVICLSAGNHAQGVALAAQKLGCDVIVMPVTTPEIKWKSVKRLGAKVVLVGDSYDEVPYAKQQGEQEYIRTTLDHPDVITGQGTIGMEILHQLKEPLHAIFVPKGGGGLNCWNCRLCKAGSLRSLGWEPADANAMALSIHHGQRVMLDKVGGFADGVAVKVVGEETFRLCRELIDGVVLVSRDAICASIKDMFEENRSILEPAGALALAGSENIVAITSGANMNFDRLRLVTELADVGRKREAVLATHMPEVPGSFKQFCEQIGPMNITEFKYRYDASKMKLYLFHYRAQGETGANVLVGIQVPSSEMYEFQVCVDNLGYEKH